MKKIIMLVFMTFAISNIYAQSRIRIAVLDFRPGVGVDEALVDGISEMLISSLFDTRRFTIIERTQIKVAIQEQGFQRTNITTGQIAQVGRLLSVEYVLVGTINFIVTDRTLEQVQTGMARGEYNIDVRIVNVQSGEVVSTAGTGVKGTETIRSVMPGLAKELVQKIELAKEEGVYKVGDFGPAGGIIVYDKGLFSNGWRYLEAAPPETEFEAEWGAFEKDIEETRSDIGFGKANTQIILKQLKQLGETGKAAQLCEALNFDGYNDWFLPSISELYLLTKTEFSNKIRLYNSRFYWSSTTQNYDDTKKINATKKLFYNYSRKTPDWETSNQNSFFSINTHTNRNVKGFVRAVRAF